MNNQQKDSQAIDEIFQSALEKEFGDNVCMSPLAASDRMGRRVHGIDLSQPLTPSQAELVAALLDRFNVVTFPQPDSAGFALSHMEHLANHFGAPVPHPINYANYGTKTAELALHPIEKRASSQSNQAFPGQIACTEGADSPAVLVVTNLIGSGSDKEPEIAGGLHWHTDIEFEPIPLSTSMFFVQKVPSIRDNATGNWVENPPREVGFYHPESTPELAELREAIPLNGETAYTDTAAAYSALNADERRALDDVMVRRRLRKDDTGWLVPLVYTNPRTGIKSLHSPIWASRGRNVAPVEVDGMNQQASREFLDRLEAHCLQPQFRYDHQHAPGDVTLWCNFTTLHNAPPFKRIINHPDDARLMYRISCKGEPAYSLPREDTDDWIESNIVPPYRTP